MKITRFLVAAIIASSATLVADETEGLTYKPYVSLGFCFAQGHAHDMTQTTWGGLGAYNAEVGIAFKTFDSKVELRPNLGMARILSKDPTEANPRVYDLVGLYVGFDVAFAPFKLPIKLTTGPSFHSWDVDQVHSFGAPARGSSSMKLGWRLGIGYEITKKWSVDLTYTLTEWRTLDWDSSYEYEGEEVPDWQFVEGFNPSRPSYFMFRATYRF